LHFVKKHIHVIIGIFVFVQLLVYNSGPAARAVSYTDVTDSFIATHPAAQLENAGHSKQITRIKFPSEHRKYGLNETNNAFISNDETHFNDHAGASSFQRSNQKEIFSYCFSLALLRAPPIV
jgi:hypothetical protein